MRIISLAVLLAAFALPVAAQAQTCTTSFTKKGNPLTGLKFSAQHLVNDITPQAALQQLRGIATSKGYQVISDESADGSLLLEQPSSGKTRTIQLLFTAQPQGKAALMQVDVKLSGGMFAGEEGSRTELCGLFAGVVGGKAGLAAAKKGGTATNVASVVEMDVLTLSQQISAEAENNSAIINTRYRGRPFILKGTVDYIRPDSGTYRVAFKIPRSTTELPVYVGKHRNLIQMGCMMARGQQGYALTLKPGSRVKFSGTVLDYSDRVDVMWFGDCRPVK